MTARPQAQIELGEQIIENAELEQALEARETAREAVAAARKIYDEADTAAKAAIAELDLDGPARCGRFVIRELDVAARSVAFETEPGTRLSISVVDDA